MMPLWLDIEDFEDEEMEALLGEFCDQCFEPLAFCNCGYSYPEISDEESEEEEDE